MQEIDRRKFMGLSLAGLAIAAAAAVTYPVFKYLSPQQSGGEKGHVTIPRTQVEAGQAHFFQFRGHPAVVLQRAPGVFVAFSAICTHLGCIIQWLPEKGEFLCPCHAGRYASDGTVLGGPPPKPLRTIPIALSGDNLMVG